MLVPFTIGMNKFVFRPWIHNHFEHSFMLILVNSLPNFVEAIIGTVLIAGIGLVVQARFFSKAVKVRTTYTLAALLAGVYVITQELNLHSLGGANVYDPFDVGASILGLITAYIFLNMAGLFTESSF